MYLVKRAEELGSKYLTVAVEYRKDRAPLVATAFCCPKDSPSRERGRDIVLGRLNRMELEEIPQSDLSKFAVWANAFSRVNLDSLIEWAKSFRGIDVGLTNIR